MVDDVRSLTEEGTPSSLLRALDLIRIRELGNTEFGRIMTGVILSLIQNLYPHLSVQVPTLYPSQTHNYMRILRNAREGIYTPPRQNTQDYLELVLPFLAFGSDLSPYPPEQFLQVLQELRRGETLNSRSVLAPYFMGLIYERLNSPNRAISVFKRAWEVSSECYPAVLGQVRVLDKTGKKQEALDMLQDLLIQFPDNKAIKQQLARIYYTVRDWPRAESAIAEILQQDSQNQEFLLLYAHTLVEKGQFFKALDPLDQCKTVQGTKALYLFLRARIQAEGYHNRGAALNYLRAILKTAPEDVEVSVYTVALLLGSPEGEEQAAGRELLQGLLHGENPALEIVDLAFRDAVRRESWEEAQGYMPRLLEGDRSEYLLDASKVEQGLGNTGEAFSYAQELYEQNPTNEAGTLMYVSVLIDRGEQDEAWRIIESRLAKVERTVKGEYYYLRSRIRGTEDEALQDLRSSLFEDPRNLHALMGMVELYHRRNDQPRLVYYLQQALSFAPDNARLRQYPASGLNAPEGPR
ncbi:putative Beta-barrel assembly-enhancing protease [Hollandina sp. SP2]